MTPEPITGNADKARAAFLAKIGLLAAVTAIVIAFAMAGAGHGWTSPLLLSLTTLITHPLAGAVFAWRSRRWALVLAVALLVLMLAGDVALYFGTRSEWFMLEKVWMSDPHIVLAWAVSWFYGQGLAALALLLLAFRLISNQTALQDDAKE